jgi:hypothetical protein
MSQDVANVLSSGKTPARNEQEMANFNLADYETVEERIARFYKDNPDGRIVTENLTTLQDRQVLTWVVKATVYLNNKEQGNTLAKATGLAFEIDGIGMANKTSALENAETSAIGRALANAGYSGNKRTSREEMEKVARGVTPTTIGQDELYAIWKSVIAAKTVDELKAIWNANTANAQTEFQDDFGANTLAKAIAHKKEQLTKPADLEVQTKLAKPATKAVAK